MKFTPIAIISILSTLASGFTLLDLSRRGGVIRPSFGKVVWSDLRPTSPSDIVGVSCNTGAPTAVAILCFIIPACIGTCTISFSDAIVASGSRGMQLFTTGRCPNAWDDWSTRPYRDQHKGTFLVTGTGAGPATVVEDFGLTFPCPTTPTKLGYEVVQVGEKDFVAWDITKGGFIITCG